MEDVGVVGRIWWICFVSSANAASPRLFGAQAFSGKHFYVTSSNQNLLGPTTAHEVGAYSFERAGVLHQLLLMLITAFLVSATSVTFSRCCLTMTESVLLVPLSKCP